MANNFLIVLADLFRIRPIFTTRYYVFFSSSLLKPLLAVNWVRSDWRLADGGEEFNCEFKNTLFLIDSQQHDDEQTRWSNREKCSYSYTSRNTEDESQCARASSTWLWGDRVRDPNIFNLSHFTSRCIASLSQPASRHAAVSLFCVENFIERFGGERERENKSVVTNFKAASLHLASFKKYS